MKIYIAGKISGDPDYKMKFQDVDFNIWRALGLASYDATPPRYDPALDDPVILNPARLPEGMEPADYMRICFAMIDSADLVMFLPDWADGAGAQLEMQYCSYIRKPVAILSEGWLL